MTKKIIINLDFYTDGDWGYDTNLFKNYTSHYIDSPVFENTIQDDYSNNIRRIFEYEDIDNAIKLLEDFSNSLYGKDIIDDIKSRFNKVIDWLKDIKITGGKNEVRDFDDNSYPLPVSISPMNENEIRILAQNYFISMDGNTEFDGTVSIVNMTYKKIKEIIFE